MASASYRISRIATLLLVFLSGAFFGRFVTPLLFRDHTVIVIKGSPPSGCRGQLGVTPILFGWVGGSGEGGYHIDCGQRARMASDLELQCNCEN